MKTVTADQLTPENIVGFIASVFENRGGEEYLGEPVTMAEHMLQSAYFAEKAGEPDIVVVAALLHDIGHFVGEFGTFSMEDDEDRHHEESGAEILAEFFPSLVVDCVRHHVAAKRYLCATKPDYFKRLSEASVHSLNLQGGPMKAEEVREFERNPNFKDIIKVRHYDEAGKQAGLTTKSFGEYTSMIQGIVDSHAARHNA